MSASYYAGFFVGILLVALVVFAIYMLMTRFASGRWALKSEYDERQQIARGKAYCAGFWTLIVANCLIYAVEMSGMILPISYLSLHILAMFFGLLVYAISCIFRDAYMGINDTPMRWIITDAAIVLLNLLCSYTNFRHGNNGWINLGCALMLAIVLVALIVKAILNRRAETDEDGEDA